MRVLVIGGAGFIGSHTVDLLLDRGYDVRILDSLEPPVHKGGVPAYVPPAADFIEGSVTDRPILRAALQGVDLVVHLAAYQDYLPDFSRFFYVNSYGTALLYEVVVNDRLPVRKIVVASSQAVYGEGRYLCARHGAQYPGQRSREQLDQRDWDVKCPACGMSMLPDWTDERVSNPHNSYAISKRDQEDIAIKLGRRYGIPSVAMRYSIVQGPRQSFRNAYSGALRSFAVRLLHDHPPVVYEDGRQLRDYVYVGDVAKANLLALADDRANYQALNVGGDRPITVLELAETAALAVGSEVTPSVPGLYRLGDTRHIFSDVSRLRGLGWQPTLGPLEIAAEYVEWARQQPDLHDTYEEAAHVMRQTGVLRGTDGH